MVSIKMQIEMMSDEDFDKFLKAQEENGKRLDAFLADYIQEVKDRHAKSQKA